MVLFYVAVYAGAALIAVAAGLTLAVIMRAIAADSHPTPTRRPSPRRPAFLNDYGLLCTVVLAENTETGRSVRDLLAAGGVRATIATGTDGLTRVLVFPTEYEQARRMVSWVL
jgi:hypothetical protein